MGQLLHSLNVFSDGSVSEIPQASVLYRVRWDDEIEEFGYKSRTASEDWAWGPQTPAVFRHYPILKDGAGDFRIDVSPIESFIRALNGNDPRKFDYWCDIKTAQFNSTGWPYMAYITMSGNTLRGRRILRDNQNVEMLEFETLTLATIQSGMNHDADPDFIHRFGIVGVDGSGRTYHTNNTPQGIIDYPLVTEEGICYIPMKYVIRV